MEPMDQTSAVGNAAGPVQAGIQRTFDEAASYYRDLRWERNRLVRFEKALTQRVLEEELGPGPFTSILEIGCGPGTWTGLLSHRARSVTAVDLSPQMLEQARQAVPSSGVHFVRADAARFDTEERFQAAVSVRVLEYIPEWAAIVARLGQLVRPQGRVVLVTKTRFSVWRGTGRHRWYSPRRVYRRFRYGRQSVEWPGFWQQLIPAPAVEAALHHAGFVDLRVRPVTFGLPIYVRGIKQYPILPQFAEPAALAVTDTVWRWVSRRGPTIRRAGLLLSESYAVSGRRA